MDEATTAARFLLGGIMLGGAVVYDLRERRVPNPWWVPFAWLAGILAVGDLASRPDWTVLGLRYAMAATVAGVAYVLWRLHLFGGADAKAIMVLAALAPWPPPGPHALQPALDALANGALAMLLVPVGFLLVNLALGRLALPAALLGVPMPLAQARRRHVWPMQVIRDGHVRWRFWHHIGRDLDADYHALERAGVRDVWATPKVPFLLPLLAGWGAAWWVGNAIVALLRAASLA